MIAVNWLREGGAVAARPERSERGSSPTVKEGSSRHGKGALG
jgi:hypothetical protein